MYISTVSLHGIDTFWDDGSSFLYCSSLKNMLLKSTGLNIQHDANHGSLSRNPNVNWLLGLSENWIGGSQINWIHQHVVQHHLHTNDVHLDPDMASTSYVR